MKKIIKGFGKFQDNRQEEIYELYKEGDLKKATFPFQGVIAEGVIFEGEENGEEVLYLIPISTIKTWKLSTSDDDDDDDDDDSDPDEVDAPDEIDD